MADALAKGKKPEQTGPKTGEDLFLQGTSRAWTWITRNLTTVVLLAAGIALVVLGSLYYVNFKASVREQAATELASIRMSGAAPEERIANLEAYIERFDGTAAADEARVMLGRMYLDADRPADALPVLEAVRAPTDHPTGYAARRLLATARESTGDTAGALDAWQSVSRDARFGFQRREAGAEAARILADQGRLDEAAAILERIVEEAADSPSEAGVYRIRLGEVNARLRADGAGSG